MPGEQNQEQDEKKLNGWLDTEYYESENETRNWLASYIMISNRFWQEMIQWMSLLLTQRAFEGSFPLKEMFCPGNNSWSPSFFMLFCFCIHVLWWNRWCPVCFCVLSWDTMLIRGHNWIQWKQESLLQIISAKLLIFIVHSLDTFSVSFLVYLVFCVCLFSSHPSSRSCVIIESRCCPRLQMKKLAWRLERQFGRQLWEKKQRTFSLFFSMNNEPKSCPLLLNKRLFSFLVSPLLLPFKRSTDELFFSFFFLLISSFSCFVLPFLHFLFHKTFLTWFIDFVFDAVLKLWDSEG